MDVTKEIRYVGVNDHEIDLFEGQYQVENGMSYNSYIIIDDKIAVFDTVDARFTEQWFDNIEKTLGARTAGLSDCTAYGAGSFCQYCEFYQQIS